jgi:hypothetical protein
MCDGVSTGRELLEKIFIDVGFELDSELWKLVKRRDASLKKKSATAALSPASSVSTMESSPYNAASFQQDAGTREEQQQQTPRNVADAAVDSVMLVQLVTAVATSRRGGGEEQDDAADAGGAAMLNLYKFVKGESEISNSPRLEVKGLSLSLSLSLSIILTHSLLAPLPRFLSSFLRPFDSARES